MSDPKEEDCELNAVQATSFWGKYRSLLIGGVSLSVVVLLVVLSVVLVESRDDVVPQQSSAKVEDSSAPGVAPIAPPPPPTLALVDPPPTASPDIGPAELVPGTTSETPTILPSAAPTLSNSMMPSETPTTSSPEMPTGQPTGSWVSITKSPASSSSQLPTVLVVPGTTGSPILPSPAPILSNGITNTTTGSTTSDTLTMMWLLGGFLQYVTDLRPPTVTATCGVGGTVTLIETSHTDVACTILTPSTIQCTSGSSVYGDGDLITNELSSNGGVSATFTCTGSSPDALMATFEVASQSYNAMGDGRNGLSTIYARVKHQLRIVRRCGSELQSLSACPSQADILFGQCLDQGFCSNENCAGMICSCSLSVPAVSSGPVWSLPESDSACLVPTVETGGSCFANGMCIGGLCSMGTCQDGLLPDTAPCESDDQCENGYCLLYDSFREVPFGCCPPGAYGWRRTISITGSVTCGSLARGMPCRTTFDTDCYSRNCTDDGICG